MKDIGREGLVNRRGGAIVLFYYSSKTRPCLDDALYGWCLSINCYSSCPIFAAKNTIVWVGFLGSALIGLQYTGLAPKNEIVYMILVAALYQPNNEQSIFRAPAITLLDHRAMSKNLLDADIRKGRGKPRAEKWWEVRKHTFLWASFMDVHCLPEYIFVPIESETTCPVKSISRQEFIAVTFGFWAIIATLLTKLISHI